MSLEKRVVSPQSILPLSVVSEASWLSLGKPKQIHRWRASFHSCIFPNGSQCVLKLIVTLVSSMWFWFYRYAEWNSGMVTKAPIQIVQKGLETQAMCSWVRILIGSHWKHGSGNSRKPKILGIWKVLKDRYRLKNRVTPRQILLLGVTIWTNCLQVLDTLFKKITKSRTNSKGSEGFV